MKTKFTFVAPALLVLLTLNLKPSTALAQGTAFTYQGRLNVNGAPANGSYDFQFRLASNPLANNYIGNAYLTNGIAVSNGLFTATLDFGPGIFTGSNYWLEVDVRTNGAGSYTALSPLQALTPTPYAIMANAASNLLGVLPAGQISGTIASAALPASPIFPGVVTADMFSGNGANVTNVNAATLGGLSAANFWQLGGNNVAGGQFLGSINNQPLELLAGGLRALRLEPGVATEGAPNVIGGSPGNFVASGTVGATIGGGGAANYYGLRYINSVQADFGTVSGGAGNTARGSGATVSGGWQNTASNNSAAVGGGLQNTASGPDATVGGGNINTASNDSATVGGGGGNTASGSGATVGGGYLNTASNNSATVSGGLANTASGPGATVGGGSSNTASGGDATVGGGYKNTASGDFTFAAGDQAQATNDGCFVWADNSQPTPFASTANDQFLIRAAGGVGINTNAPSGTLTINTGVGALTFRNDNGIAPGLVSDAGYLRFRNRLEVWPNDDATVSGYVDVRNTSGNPTISLDGQSGTITCMTLNQTSDRNAKENFTAVNPAAILAKVVALPLSEWNYKTDPVDEKHLGPMAQDFHAAFGLNGSDDKHISTVDEGGVALAAIQGLNEKLEEQIQEKDAQIQQQNAQIQTLQKQLNELAAEVKLLAQGK